MKHTFYSSLFAISLIFATSCQEQQKKMADLDPPKAKKVAKELTMHGDTRIDNYYWLNQREDQEVIDYLSAENDYYKGMTGHTDDFKKDLYEEMRGRIKEDDSSVPYKRRGFYYSTRYEEGYEYPIYGRFKDSLTAKEQIMFDCNELAKGHEFYNLRGVSVSPDNSLAAFGVDTISRRQYHIQVKNLVSGEIYPDKIDNTTGSAVWADDNKTLFYTKKDPVTLRSSHIYKHVLGTPSDQDELIFHEEDDTFSTYVYKTKSEKFIIIGSYSTLTAEFQILEANNPNGKFKVFSPRERGLEYNIAHHGSEFYIRTNKDGATNFKLMKTPDDDTNKDQWKDFIAHREDVLLQDIDTFKDYYVLSERDNGLNKIKIVRWDGSDSYYIPFDNETYVAWTSTNPEFDTEILRISYSAMTNPTSVIDFNMRTREKEIKKEQEILGGKFDKANYRSERVWAPTKDGSLVAISLVYHKDTDPMAGGPLLQYAYGSYGSTSDPYFSSVRLSLLDRGFIFAVAHVRGGQYLGRPWYEDGKLLNKINTFTDFIDCSKFLIKSGYTSKAHLYANGGSAGGLLMGAVVNMAPELYHGVIAAVPFVDVVTTMLDDSIPLTTGEYDEWGNPNDETYYQYMKSYSPYDNVEAKAYPNLYVTTGLHDSQVQYWEPAKWVAKLREYKTDDNLLFLDTNMDAGHGGASGRFESLKEYAKEYAFLLDLEEISQ